MGKRNLEIWSLELFPGFNEEGWKAYDHLNGRELVIVGAAVIDSALLELIEMRLVDNETEQDGLLGITRFDSPVASLTSRARLAFLLGLIRQSDAETIRVLANLRNHMAHRATATLADPKVLKFAEKLMTKGGLVLASDTVGVKDMMVACKRETSFTEDIIRAILLHLQFRFDNGKDSIQRLEECSVIT
jgi:DNA-binding MltR family transcriptional regulator